MSTSQIWTALIIPIYLIGAHLSPSGIELYDWIVAFLILAIHLTSEFLGRRMVKKAERNSREEVIETLGKLAFALNQIEKDKRDGSVRYMTEERLAEIKKELAQHTEYTKNTLFDDNFNYGDLYRKLEPIAKEIERAF